MLERGSREAFELGAPSSPSSPGRGGAVVVHGFSGSPFEVRPLGEALARGGWHVLGPALAGHANGRPEELARTGWREWYASLVEAFEAQRRRHARVVVVGFSMGGLLALHLAATRPAEVAALGALGVPLWLPERTMRALRALGRVREHLGRLPGGERVLARLPHIPKVDGMSDLRDRAMRLRNPTMPAMPLAALTQLVALADLVRGELPQVTAPTFVAHGEQDHTAPPACADELVARLGARTIERLRLPESYHLIPLDVERTRLQRALVDFVDKELP
jgi:carboxylesterase